MCTTDGTCAKDWKEAISNAIGQPCSDVCPEDEPESDL